MTEHEYINEDLRPLAVPIDTLTPDPKNARRHSRRNLDAIKASLVEEGQHSTIIVWAQTEEQGGQKVVMAGNGTITAAQELGWTHIAANVKAYADLKAATAAAIRDNRTAELADWDFVNLTENLDLLAEEALGFNAAEINALLDQSNAATAEIDLEKRTKNDGKGSTIELDESSFQEFDHKCPRCKFEFDEKVGPS